MLHKSMILFTVLILCSLILAPSTHVRAYDVWAAADKYEPDNKYTEGKLITSGTPQTRSITPIGDADWIKFQLTSSASVILQTTGPFDSDTRMRVFQAAFPLPVEVEANDDDGVGYYSYIDRLCNENPLPAGTYYVRIEEYLNNDDIPTYELYFQSSPCPAEVVDIYAAGEKQGNSLVPPGGSTRRSLAFVNNGPVQIVNTGGSPLIAAERVVYKVNNVGTSFTELMALPNSQLDKTYWLPWYNNVELDTQLRMANVSAAPATVWVYIGGKQMSGTPFSLQAGESTRKSFVGVNNGPVQVVSTENIVAAERVVYKVNGVGTSFTEMMGLPANQLDNTYWLPWYNNVELDTQLRIANVSDAPASVQIFIGEQQMAGSPFPLAPGASARKSYAGVNNGPVQIVSDVPIVAAERVVYKVNGVNTSFTEMMALPNNQLDLTYWLPWYNNVELDTQIRFANVSGSQANVYIYVGGQEMAGSPFSVAPGESTRKSFSGVSNGPVRIVSDVPIVAAERVVYKVNNIPTSFSEMMALPQSQLNTRYWLPWYNNVDLDTQLRFGLP